MKPRCSQYRYRPKPNQRFDSNHYDLFKPIDNLQFQERQISDSPSSLELVVIRQSALRSVRWRLFPHFIFVISILSVFENYSI